MEGIFFWGGAEHGGYGAQLCFPDQFTGTIPEIYEKKNSENLQGGPCHYHNCQEKLGLLFPIVLYKAN